MPGTTARAALLGCEEFSRDLRGGCCGQYSRCAARRARPQECNPGPLIAKTLESLEGKLEAFYFALGSRDVIVIAELPDAVSAAALSLAVSASGLVRITTTALLGVEEVHRALAKKVAYRAPGT